MVYGAVGGGFGRAPSPAHLLFRRAVIAGFWLSAAEAAAREAVAGGDAGRSGRLRAADAAARRRHLGAALAAAARAPGFAPPPLLALDLPGALAELRARAEAPGGRGGGTKLLVTPHEAWAAREKLVAFAGLPETLSRV